MGSIAWGGRVLAEARHGVSPSRAREKRAAAGQNLGNARYVNHGPEMSRALAGVSFDWGNPRRRHIGAHGQESEEYTSSNRALGLCARQRRPWLVGPRRQQPAPTIISG